MEEILSEGLSSLGLTAPPDAPETLARFGQLLLEKNQVMNLTAIREETGVARLHLLDSAALALFADLSAGQLIDVGSGGGFPGLPLKILRPGLSLTLLDSQRKRVDWLEEVTGQLGLSGVRAVQGRAEELGRDAAYRGRFDFATARAVAELRVLCELCLPFLKPGGLFLAMKGRDCQAELEAAQNTVKQLNAALEDIRDYPIPGTDIVHRVLLFRKLGPTPNTYPRRWKQIKSGA